VILHIVKADRGAVGDFRTTTTAREVLRELAQVLPVMGLPEMAAEAYGTIRAELERKGRMIGNNDLWIAAHAKAVGLTLATNNERKFRRVRGLKVENWVV